MQALSAQGPGGRGVAPAAANLHHAVRRARAKAHGAVWDHSRAALVAVLANGSPLGRTAAAQVLGVLARGVPARLTALSSSLRVLVRLTCAPPPPVFCTGEGNSPLRNGSLPPRSGYETLINGTFWALGSHFSMPDNDSVSVYI